MKAEAVGGYLFLLSTIFSVRCFASFTPRDWLSLSLHRSGEKITDLFIGIDVRKEVAEAHFEYADEIQLLKVAHMHQTAFDLGNLTAINVPTCELQPHRQVGLAPTEAVSPSHNFRANEVLVLHAALAA